MKDDVALLYFDHDAKGHQSLSCVQSKDNLGAFAISSCRRRKDRFACIFQISLRGKLLSWFRDSALLSSYHFCAWGLDDLRRDGAGKLALFDSVSKVDWMGPNQINLSRETSGWPTGSITHVSMPLFRESQMPARLCLILYKRKGGDSINNLLKPPNTV